ncbi:MAG: RNA-binding S4 domain-containing protein [Planctomyces sp.]
MSPSNIPDRNDAESHDLESETDVHSEDSENLPERSARPLCLDQFLKLCSAADTGGRAKWMIQHGEVKVNGQVETRRRRKLAAGDVVELSGQRFLPDEFLLVD